MSIKEKFDKVSGEYKVDFLYSLLQEDEVLARRFFKGAISDKLLKERDAGQVGLTEFAEYIEQSYQEYKLELEEEDFGDIDWENFVPPHNSYIPQWEAEEYAAEEMADNLVANFEENMVNLLLTGKLEFLFGELIAFCFAARDADINDPYERLGEDYFVYKSQEYIKKAVEKVSISKIEDMISVNTIQLFFQYFEMRDEKDRNEIINFEKLLILIVKKVNDKHLLIDVERNIRVDYMYFPSLSLLFAKIKGDENGWLTKAKNTFLINEDVAMELLDFYLNEDYESYIEVAVQLFKSNERHWARIVSENIIPDIHLDFYKDVYVRLCISEMKIEDYRKVRNYLSGEEKKKFYDRIYNKVYLAGVYYEDGLYDEIKKLVEKDTDSWYFDEIIELIVKIYPDFCFGQIMKRVLNILAKQRGRSAYRTIASSLQIAETIPSYQVQTQKLIMKIYNHKPNLPALKDELRKAGLVNKSFGR